jgi:hypothetical protein
VETAFNFFTEIRKIDFYLSLFYKIEFYLQQLFLISYFFDALYWIFDRWLQASLGRWLRSLTRRFAALLLPFVRFEYPALARRALERVVSTLLVRAAANNASWDEEF